MKAWKLMTVVALLAMVVCVAGCGTVYLKGEALTAAETSALDAYGAAQRAEATTTTQPSWQQAYLVENFKQWRSFVRSARKEAAWGPKLAGE
jgi:hypothetical protein